MKKNFVYYALIWAVLMAVFCAVVTLDRISLCAEPLELCVETAPACSAPTFE